MKEPFKTDIEAIRARARAKMQDGAVTGAYLADREKVLDVLNEILATEIVCMLRYKNHYFLASGINAQPIAQEFLQHANEEQAHADWVSERITQLGGVPNMNPEGLATRAHANYVEGTTLDDMIKENLVAERIAIETYSEIIRWLGDDDPTTRRIVEDILKQEEEHADDLANMLATLAPGTRPHTAEPAERAAEREPPPSSRAARVASRATRAVQALTKKNGRGLRRAAR